VGDRRCEFDVPHSLPSHFGLDDFHAAFLADDPAVFHSLVFAAVAFVVLDGTEDLRAEEPVPFRLERAVIDRLGLFHLSVRSFSYLLGRSERDLHCIVARGILGLRKEVV
jgi:hypothetical protein